jgi:hypothetical protein
MLLEPDRQVPNWQLWPPHPLCRFHRCRDLWDMVHWDVLLASDGFIVRPGARRKCVPR